MENIPPDAKERAPSSRVLKELLDQAETSKSAKIAAMFIPHMPKLARTYLERAARSRCLIIVLAAERFRMNNGNFPDTVAALVPAYLDKELFDPFNGEPLHIRRFEKGIEVRSVAEDDKPDDNRLDIHGTGQVLRPIKDVRYRLWDVSARGLPPGSTKKNETP